MKWRIYYIVLLLFINNNSFSQQITFNSTYGKLYEENAKTLIFTSDENYILVGESESFGSGDTDILVVKTDKFGDTIWTNIYKTLGYEYATGVIEDAAGEYVVSAYGSEIFGEDNDFFVFKISKNGSLIWSKKLGGDFHEKSYGLIESNQGDYVVFGLTTSYGAGSSAGFASGFVTVLDINGNLVWSKNYGDNEWDKINDISNTSDGGFIMTGWMESYGAGRADMFLVKTDHLGEVEWFHVYGTLNIEEGRKVIQLQDGGYVVGGMANDALGMNDMFLTRVDSVGNLLWTNVYGDLKNDELTFLKQFKNKELYFGGYSEDTLTTNVDVVIIKADLNGDTLLTAHYGLDSIDLFQRVKSTAHQVHLNIANDLIIHPDETVSFAGSIENINNGYEFYLVKTTENLDVECQKLNRKIKQASVVFAADTDEITVDTGCIINTLVMTNNNVMLDVNRYCGKNIYLNKEEGIDHDMVKIFPNPFKNYFLVKNNSSSYITILIYDVLGNVIQETLMREKVKHFDLSSYKSGIYIVQYVNLNNFKQKSYKVIKID